MGELLEPWALRLGAVRTPGVSSGLDELFDTDHGRMAKLEHAIKKRRGRRRMELTTFIGEWSRRLHRELQLVHRELVAHDGLESPWCMQVPVVMGQKPGLGPTVGRVQCCRRSQWWCVAGSSPCSSSSPCPLAAPGERSLVWQETQGRSGVGLEAAGAAVTGLLGDAWQGSSMEARA